VKLVFHPEVRSDLDMILDWLSSGRPDAIEPLLQQIDEAIARVSVWPKVAPTTELGNDTRVVTLTRYPYRIFYRVTPDAIEVLHIRHTSRAPWEGDR
jgi:toxin ParE1/3/4